MSSSVTCRLAGSSGLSRASRERSQIRNAVIASKARHLRRSSASSRRRSSMRVPTFSAWNKTAKWFLAVESFRSESERGVLQELYANFVMVTATRLMTNVIDAEINAAQDHRPPKRVNFKHAVAAVFRNFEALALVQAEAVAETVARIVDDIAAFWQRERPGRSYPRMSLKPARKWTRKGKASTTT